MRPLLVAALLVALSGCGATTPEDELAQRADAVTAAANERDAQGVRQAALALGDAVSVQRDAGELSAERAERLLALSEELRAQADLLDPQVQAEQEAAREAAQREAAAREAAQREAAEREAAQREAAQREAAQREAAQREGAQRESEPDEDEPDEDEPDDDGGKGRGGKDKGD